MYQGLSYDLANVMPAAVATGLFVSLATFQEPDGLLTGAGQPSGNYVDVAGYVGIQCMSAPTKIPSITATEAKSAAEIESSNSSHVLLSGYYPDIASHTEWRAVIDGVIYNILGAESDSQSQMTRVQVEVVTI